MEGTQGVEGGTKKIADSDSDKALLAAMASPGCLEAAERLFLRYEHRAHGLALRITHNRALAEEAVQEAMLCIWKKAGATSHLENPGAWIMGVVAKEALRAVQREPCRKEESQGREALGGAEEEATPLQIAANHELRAVLRQNFNGLPEEEQKVMLLYYVSGFTQGEIALELSVSQQAVSKMLQRALATLRQRLSQAGFVSLGVETFTVGLGEAVLADSPIPSRYHARLMNHVLAHLYASSSWRRPSILAKPRFSSSLACWFGAGVLALLGLLELTRLSSPSLPPAGKTTAAWRVAEMTGPGAKRILAGGGSLANLEQGCRLGPGDELRTDAQSQIVLELEGRPDETVCLREGGQLRIGAQPDRGVPSRKALPEDALFLNRGALAAHFLKTALTIVSPHVKIKTEGAAFFLMTPEARWPHTRLEVTQGQAWVHPREDPSRSQTVMAGYALCLGVGPPPEFPLGFAGPPAPFRAAGRELSPLFEGFFSREAAQSYQAGHGLLSTLGPEQFPAVRRYPPKEMLDLFKPDNPDLRLSILPAIPGQTPHEALSVNNPDGSPAKFFIRLPLPRTDKRRVECLWRLNFPMDFSFEETPHQNLFTGIPREFRSDKNRPNVLFKAGRNILWSFEYVWVGTAYGGDPIFERSISLKNPGGETENHWRGLKIWPEPPEGNGRETSFKLPVPPGGQMAISGLIVTEGTAQPRP